MFKVIWLLKRKQGVSHQQFRERYERHARLGHKYASHLMIGVRRNYKTETWSGASGNGFEPVSWDDYDCITEWFMPHEGAFNEICRLLADPAIGKEFYDDEEDFLDRKSLLMIKCDTLGTGGGCGEPKLDPA
jgi:hypothetical protein